MYSCGQRIMPKFGRKPTLWMPRKAAALYATWRVYRTPPGSGTRACVHKGSSGNGEIRMFPCANKVSGADSE